MKNKLNGKHAKSLMSDSEVFMSIVGNKPIEHAIIKDKIYLSRITDEENGITQKVIFKNCEIEFLDCQTISFNERVEFHNCKINRIDFNWSYFVGGLIIDECDIDNEVVFDFGGHNQKDKPIIIECSKFRNFVSFVNCLYYGPVIIRENTFMCGSNLLGNRQDIFASFFDAGDPLVENNIGQLTLN